MQRKATRSLKAISLFTGAGGLDLGLEAAGFQPLLCVEVDTDARETLRINRPQWKLADPGNILILTPEQLKQQAGVAIGDVALLAAGPVCQPFSHAARWSPKGATGLSDPRSQTIGATLDTLEALLPAAVLIENVAGISSTNGRGATHEIMNRVEAVNRRHGVKYRVQGFMSNSAHYGVPQFRKRYFIVMHRDGRTLTPPEATHGEERAELIRCWDAIGDLAISEPTEDLLPRGKWAGLLPTIPEGGNYLWHTSKGGGRELFGWRTRYWSFLLKLAKDRPAWTLTAQPGSATGPFHWMNRRLSVREMARLQTFPDEHVFSGSPASQRRQLGNAVPCLWAEVLGRAIAEQWFDRSNDGSLIHVVPRRGDCPPAGPIAAVPCAFLCAEKEYPPHPGTGRGPGAQRILSTPGVENRSNGVRTTPL